MPRSKKKKVEVSEGPPPSEKKEQAPLPTLRDLSVKLPTEVSKAWNKLSYREQNFMRIWMTNGFVATKAYLEAFPTASKETAAAKACGILRRPAILLFRAHLSTSLFYPVERCNQVMVDGLEDPDPAIRLRAAKQLMEYHENVMRGLEGLKEALKGGGRKVNVKINNRTTYVQKIFNQVKSKGLLNTGAEAK